MDLSSLDTKLGVGIGIATVLGFCVMKFLRQKYDADDHDDDSDDSESEQEDICTEKGEYKLVLLIRNDLKMGKGKVAAQCAHAAVAAYKSALKHKKVLRPWERNGQAKITLKVESEEELLTLAKEARREGLLANVISDAGRTQIEAGSKTVCAIGPGPVKVINRVTGHLKLY